MGDQNGDSSSAAQRARETEEQQPGLLKRLFRGFGGNGGTQSDGEDRQRSTVNGVPAVGMMNLRRMRVEDVAIPKVEIEAVPCDISKDDLVALFRKSGLTRLPVYDGTLDTPLGFVHLKDIALRHGFDAADEVFVLTAMVRPLIYAPPSMGIGVLLQKMQTERIHMALVIDEYGGVDGLVTIEDLIEQVIGEIEDEHDTAEGQPWMQENPGCYVVKARAPLDEFEAEIGLKLSTEQDDEEIDTLGGLVFVLTGRVPARGEVIPHETGTEFEVLDADPRRIKRLRVRLPTPGSPEA